MCVAPFHYRPKPYICHLKPVTCRPALVSSRHRPVKNCRLEPPCVVTDTPKRLTGFQKNTTNFLFLWAKKHFYFFTSHDHIKDCHTDSRLKQDFINFFLQETLSMYLKLAPLICSHFVSNLQRYDTISAHVPKRVWQFASEKL